MKQYKIRTFSKSKNGLNGKLGITLPKGITTFYPEETYFKIELCGAGSILLISGTLIKSTTQEIRHYNFEDIRI